MTDLPLADDSSDSRGVQFDAEFFWELCQLLDIKSRHKTVHDYSLSQANGGTERVNREVQLYPLIFCINHPSTWNQALKKAEFIYNNQPHADRT